MEKCKKKELFKSLEEPLRSKKTSPSYFETELKIAPEAMTLIHKSRFCTDYWFLDK